MLVILFLAVDVMSNINRFGTSASVLMTYYFFYIPFVAYSMIPVSALLAMVSLISGLVRTSELVAMHSMGYGMASVLRYVLIFLVIMTGFLVWMGDVIIPLAMEKRDYIFYFEMQKRPDKFTKNKTKNIWYRTKSAIIHFENILDGENISGVNIYFVRPEWGLLRLIEAKNLSFNDKFWFLKNVELTEFMPDQESFEVQHLKTLEIPSLTELESIKMSRDATDYLSSSELWSIIKKNTEGALDTAQFKVALYSKYSFALSVLILPLLGLCTVNVNRRSGNAFLSGAIAIGIVFVYWMLYNSALSYGRAGLLPPLLAAMLIPIIAFLAIIFAIRRVLN